MNKIITFLFLSLTTIVSAQKSNPIKAKLKEVVCYQEGAQLSYSAKVSLQKGKQKITLEGNAGNLIESTIQVKIPGKVLILGVRAELNHDDLNHNQVEIEKLNNKKEQLQQEKTEVNRQISILQADLDFLNTNRNVVGNNGAKVLDLKENFAFVHQKKNEITSEMTQLNKKYKDLSYSMDKLTQEIIAKNAEKIKEFTDIIVEMESELVQEVQVDYSYLTPDASWEVAYDFRSEGLGQLLTLDTKAKIKQNTGFDWKDVKMVLSTSEPMGQNANVKLDTWTLAYGNYPQTKANSVIAKSYEGKRIEGRVTDLQSGEPIPFVTLTIQGDEKLVINTDLEGNFSFYVPKNASYVALSSVGFKSKTVQIDNSYLNLQMEYDVVELEEVMISRSDDEDKEQLSSGVINSYQMRKAAPSADVLISSESLRKGSINSTFATTIYATNISLQQKAVVQEYAIEGETTVLNNATPTTVSIKKDHLEATYTYTCTPKLDNKVHLSADVINWQNQILLSGKGNLYFEGSFVGEVDIDVTNTSDTLTLALGIEPKIKVERIKVPALCSMRTIGNRRHAEIGWEIKLKSVATKPVNLVLYDQIPVTYTDDIKVKKGKIQEGELNETTGVITWRISLNGGESKSYTFDYSVDYNKNSVLYLE